MSDDRSGRLQDATEAMIQMRDPVARRPVVRNGSVADIADEELLRRAVGACRGRQYRRGANHPRWAAVADNFLLGSTYASQLCRRFGLDPNEQVKR